MNIKRFLVWIFLLTGILTSSLLFAQEMVFSAHASAAKVGLQDQFQLTYTLQNAPDASDFQPPPFSGFSIIGGPAQSQSSNISIINGRTQQTSTVQVTYVLQANRTGKLTIPPAEIVVDNQKYTSNVVTINVVKGSVAPKQGRGRQSDDPFDDPFFQDPFQAMRQQQQQMQKAMRQLLQQQRPRAMVQPDADMSEMDEEHIHKNIFIKVEVDKKHPHVGEQITASYKLYTRLPMNMNLTQLPSLNGFWSEDFKIPNPPKPHKEIVDGKTYQVFLLKKSALFPQQSGKLILDPAKAEGIVRVFQKTKAQDPFADDPRFGSLFMQDPFFNNNAFSGYSYKDVKVKLSSTPVTIDVAPLPVKNQPPDFSGAVGHFSVRAQVDTNVVTTDAPVAFHFIVFGSGNLKLMGNPDIKFPEGLGVYDPEIKDTIISRSPSISGEKEFTYILSPQQPGEYTIPPVTFSYFDPQEGKYKTLNTQPVKIKVVKGKSYQSPVTDEALPADIHDIEKESKSIRITGLSFADHFWYWGLYLAAVLALGILLLLHRRKKQALENVDLWKNKKANKVAWKRLASARKLLMQKEHVPFYEAVSKAIWLYLSDKLGLPLAVLSKENIAGKLAANQVGAAQIEAVHGLLSECEMALYSPAGGQKQKENTLKEAADLIGDLEKVLKTKK